MTREEILQTFSDINHAYNNSTKYDTLKRMLDELTEPCEGCISRLAAIDKMQELENEDIKIYGCSIPEVFDGQRAIEALKALPSVQPNSKTDFEHKAEIVISQLRADRDRLQDAIEKIRGEIIETFESSECAEESGCLNQILEIIDKHTVESEVSDAKVEKVIKMRDATPEERESIGKYIKSISKPTGVDLWDLEPKFGEDCISRAEALEAIRRLPNAGIRWFVSAESVFDALLKLQPVTPKPKTGHWIMSDDGLYRPICDNCGAHPWKGYIPTVEEATEVFKYCPNCGAKMESEDKE